MGKEITVEELKKIQLEVLDAFVNYCQKYQLRYFLSCGTLLGAVRHKGYIPWDDDIDVMMPRPDYDKLIKHFNEQVSNYKLTHHSIDSNYPLAYAKVYDTRTVVIEKVDAKYKLGVNIDIFPLDGVPDKLEKTKKHLRRVLKWRNINGYKLGFVNPKIILWKRFVLLFFKSISSLISFKAINKKINNIVTSYDYDKSKFVSISVFPDSDILRHRKEVFSSFIEVNFEGKMYNAPIGYDEYLKNSYGDYMQFPPKEEQVAHHSFDAYFLD